MWPTALQWHDGAGALILCTYTTCTVALLHHYQLRYSLDVNSSELSAYLSLGACMNGLKILVSALYGVNIEVVSPEPSECWHSSVHKIEV